MRSLLIILLALAIVGATMARCHGRHKRHNRRHHDNDKNHHDSDESHHGRHRRHHDSDESHHDKHDDSDHHDSDESHHSRHHDSDESHHNKHDDSDHHDSDESHHSRHHDSDESRHGRHHDSDDSHHSRHHDSDESHHSDESDEDHHDDDHEYHIHIGDGFGPYEYLDPKDGRLKGFDIDLTHAVCAAAHKKCHIVHDTDDNCWHTSGAHQLPGPGLLDHWYDGCMGLSPTPERLNSFNFTNSHSANEKAGLYFRNGEAPAKNDLTGKKIGFVSGWAMSRACLARQDDSFDGNHEPEYTAVIYETHDDMVQGLLKKEVDGALSIEAVAVEGVKLNVAPAAPWFYCTLAGQSVMTRYGSDLIPWWNKALDKLINTGEYKKLCNKAKDLHAGRGVVHCLD